MSPEALKKLFGLALEEDKHIPKAIYLQFLLTTCEKIYNRIQDQIEGTMFAAIASPNDVINSALRKQNASYKTKDGKIVKKQLTIWPLDRFQSVRENQPNKELVVSALPHIKHTLSGLGFNPSCKDCSKRNNAVIAVNQLMAFLYMYSDKLANKGEIIVSDIDYIYEQIKKLVEENSEALKDVLNIQQSLEERREETKFESLFSMPDSMKDIPAIPLSKKIRAENQLPQRVIADSQARAAQKEQQESKEEQGLYVPPYLYDNDSLTYLNCPTGKISEAVRMSRKEALNAFLTKTKEAKRVKTNVYIVDIGSRLI